MCPCGNQRHWSWHTANGVPVCENAREMKRESNRQARKRKGWLPGSPIYVPIYEAP